jgi:hypothetical protein
MRLAKLDGFAKHGKGLRRGKMVKREAPAFPCPAWFAFG